MNLCGVIPAVPTPFAPDGSVDVAAFEANLESFSEQDLAGYLVLGSNGEAVTLTEGEKLDLVRAARRRTGAARTLLVGSGLESTAATSALTRKLADLGADAALVLTPHYFKSQMTEDVLRRHYETVADASPIPVLLYTVPSFTGLSCPPGLPAALSEHPRIAGMKESGGDIALLGRILASVPGSFRVACGSGPVFYPALCLGAAAGILAVASCAPRPAAALFRAFHAGDHARARKIQEALTPLSSAVTSLHGVAGLKAAMDVAGWRGGSVRAPLQSVSPATRAGLAPLLAQAEAAV